MQVPLPQQRSSSISLSKVSITKKQVSLQDLFHITSLESFVILQINSDYRLSGFKPNLLNIPMTENRATQAKKNTAKTYLIMTAIFVAIFAGITLLALFIARLGW